MRSRRRSTVLLLLAAAALAGCSEDPPDGIASSLQPSFLQLRLAHEERARDSEAVRFGRVILYLDAEPVAADSDIVAVDVQRDRGGMLLNMRLSEEATGRLAEVTRDNVGSRIALLIDSRIHAAPTITSEIDGPMEVTLDMSELDAEWTEQRIRARWPQP